MNQCHLDFDPLHSPFVWRFRTYTLHSEGDKTENEEFKGK